MAYEAEKRLMNKHLEKENQMLNILSLLANIFPLLLIVLYYTNGKKKLPLDVYAQMKREKIFTMIQPEDIKEQLDDIRGINEIREEVENLVKMLKDPEAYDSKGAKQIAGVMLLGQPGTGKTMLARAIAKESGVNFFY